MFADFRMKVWESVGVKYLVVELLSTGKHSSPFYCRPFHPIIKGRVFAFLMFLNRNTTILGKF